MFVYGSLFPNRCQEWIEKLFSMKSIMRAFREEEEENGKISPVNEGERGKCLWAKSFGKANFRHSISRLLPSPRLPSAPSRLENIFSQVKQKMRHNLTLPGEIASGEDGGRESEDKT